MGAGGAHRRRGLLVGAGVAFAGAAVALLWLPARAPDAASPITATAGAPAGTGGGPEPSTVAARA